jgi:hypothetical protein
MHYIPWLKKYIFLKLEKNKYILFFMKEKGHKIIFYYCSCNGNCAFRREAQKLTDPEHC